MPIRWRLTVFNALSIGAILVVLGLSLFFLLRSALYSGVEKEARERALAAAETIEAGERLDPEEAERLSLGGVFVVVRDEQGRILEETVSSVSDEEVQDPLWFQAIDSGRPLGGTADYSPSAPDYVYAVPVTPPDGQEARVVEAGQSYGPATDTLETFAAILFGGILVAFLLSLGGAYLLARVALSPVDAVVQSARQIGESDLSKRLPVRDPRGEIGRLTTTINGLLERLEGAFARREEALSRQRRFVADAGHELKTPLTSIAGYARMLKDWGLEDSETAREGIAAILEESGRMSGLVESLLALARGDDVGLPLELAAGDLGAVTAEAVRAARAAAGNKTTVEYLPPENPVWASFDRARIRQVAIILLDNALKYTPEGGSIKAAARERDGWVEIEVSDTGIGIPESQLPFIFERFYQADPARTAGGAGLGLSIARQIAEAHGGRIEAQSTPEKGSRFILLLPKEPPVPEEPGSADALYSPQVPMSS